MFDRILDIFIAYLKTFCVGNQRISELDFEYWLLIITLTALWCFLIFIVVVVTLYLTVFNTKLMFTLTSIATIFYLLVKCAIAKENRDLK
jgi:hypothetical protein